MSNYNQTPDNARDPYSELKKYPQWILWAMVDGRKVPCNPHTGIACNAHDPIVWMSWDHVQQALVRFPGHRLAFVIQANDPFFFHDIDKCLINGAWSPGALSSIAMLPGALVEVSVSGTGLHIIGKYAALVEHGCKNTANNIELYTRDRFIAMGNMETARGDSGAVVDIKPLVDAYFPPSKEMSMPWSNVPVPEWNGITENDMLIAKMCASVGSGVFGGKATPKDLWENNEAVLARCYPVQNDRDPYDRSSADAALLQHLAFWTGKNHQRMFDLMWRDDCKLRREKWYKHSNYLMMSVGNAVGRCNKVYGEGAAKAGEGNDAGAPVDMSRSVDARQRGTVTVSMDQLLPVFEPFVYITSRHVIFDKRCGATYTPAQFRALMGGLEFRISVESKYEKNAFTAYTENGLYEFPKHWDLEFMPNKPAGTVIQRNGRQYINSCVLFPPVTKKGDVSIALDHIKRMFPNGDDAIILLTWIAVVVRNLGSKVNWAPILVGCEGNGKSWIGMLIEYIIGEIYTARPNARDISNKFNAWMESALLVIVDEVNANGDGSMMDAFKILITSPRMEIQAKGVDAKTGPNWANFLLMSNCLDGLPITGDTRRVCVFVSNQMKRAELDRDFPAPLYFKKLFDWTNNGGFEMFAHYMLFEFEIDPRYDPLGAAVTAPRTSTTEQAVKASLCPIAQRVQDAIDDSRPGFKGGWAYSEAIKRLLRETGEQKVFKGTSLAGVMASLGYITHPGLGGGSGRVNNAIPQEGTSKGKLFIKQGSGIEMMGYAASEIEKAFVAAQGYRQEGDNIYE